MARLLRGCPFGPFFDWQCLDKYGMIDETPLNKPPHPYAKRIVVTKDDDREHHGKVILDDGTHGPEWAIVNNIPTFKLELADRFNLEGGAKFKYFSGCVTSQAATYWSNLMENEFPLTQRTNEDFKDATVCYLEEVADLQFMGDCILRWIAK